MTDKCNTQTCDNCACNKICNHDLFGFENCGNWILDKTVNIGDTVYYITGIGHNLVKPARVKEIILNENGVSYLYVAGDVHNFEASFDTFYLSKEQAEQALLKNQKGCKAYDP